MTVTLGIDHFLKDHLSLVQNKKVGLLTHSGCLNKDFHNTHLLFHNHPQINLVKIFGPEHGLFGCAQDMETVTEEFDPQTKLPIVSLYGKTVESLTPSQSDLEDIDVFVCDFQDVGSRYYTYIYTMAFCMQACAKAGIPVIVLDRPNPLGGNKVEGNILDIHYRSFVGWYELPVCHGMTAGELAQMFNKDQNIGCNLTVIPMQNYKRKQTFDQTGLPWTATSPNMPALPNAIVYPGMCLVEATEYSEARGTTMPFLWFGAPDLNEMDLCKRLNELKLTGIHFRPIRFKPTFQKHAHKECAGFEMHVTDSKTFEAYKTGLTILKILELEFSNTFHWREKPYEFVEDIPAIDLLTGNDVFRTQTQSLKELNDWMETFSQQESSFKQKRQVYLLY